MQVVEDVCQLYTNVLVEMCLVLFRNIFKL